MYDPLVSLLPQQKNSTYAIARCTLYLSILSIDANFNSTGFVI